MAPAIMAKTSEHQRRRNMDLCGYNTGMTMSCSCASVSYLYENEFVTLTPVDDRYFIFLSSLSKH